MVRVCPERDAICPHGMTCPYTKDRYECDRKAEAADAGRKAASDHAPRAAIGGEK